MVRWNFPGNSDGQIKGVADAGIENFNGTELSSLAREICQNSLDAAVNDDNPEVIVEFYRYRVTDSQIPGMEEYRSALQKCQMFWSKTNSEKTNNFLNNAIKNALENKSYILRISDYQTTGLADPYGEDDPSGISFDGWNALIKIDGGANKGEDKAGAFGIGKSAPFCNSHYRLVFYRTLNEKGVRAAQGMSRLLSFPEDDNDPKRTMTSGIGYYGNPDGNMPVKCIPELDDLNIRNDVGTDVFIYGFNGPIARETWEGKIVSEILDSFLMSIFRGSLCVRIQDEEINAKNLGMYVNRYKSTIKSTYCNYQVLKRKDDVHEYSMDFHGMGTVELKILIAPEEKLDKKILIVRKAGMKLFRLGRLSKLVSFSGILELKGKVLNSYFREMETVAHDNWVPGRHSNPEQAKLYYDEIKEWIRNIIINLAEYTSDDEMDVEGLGGVLQKEPKYAKKGESDNKRETLNDYLGHIDIISRQSTTLPKGFFYGQGVEGHGKMENVHGTLGKGENGGLRILKGKRKRKKLDEHKGNPTPDGEDIVVQRNPGGESTCPLKNVRIIKQSSGKYMLNFEVPRAVMKGRIELVTIGENGKSNKIRITDTQSVVGCSEVHLTGNSIAFSNMKSDEKIKINVLLSDNHDYAMEVNVYEHN